MTKKFWLKKLILKIKHRCSVIQDEYPNNYGDIRIVKCVQCNKYYLMRLSDKQITTATIKKFKNVGIYIRTCK